MVSISVTPISGNNRCQVPVAKNFVEHMTDVIGLTKKHLIVAQQRQKFYADKHRREISFEVDQQILVSTTNIKLKVPGARKLLPRWIGPFWIIKRIGVVAYRVQLPNTFKIHDVFHVSLLRPYVADGRVQPPPPPIFEEDASYEVEHVLSHEDRGSRSRPKKFYLIKWLGYALEHNSWEPECNLSVEVLKEYWDAVAKSEDRLTRKGVKRDREAPAAQKRLRRKESSG